METDICIKNVGAIEGTFVVGSYQRGYRWDEQVKQLLDDLRQSVEAGTDYYLQPIVLRRREDGIYSLIDGQQRLTTLYIFLSFLKRKYNMVIDLDFSLKYDTRPLSEEFLQNPDEKNADDDIDFFFMNKANKTIGEWFDDYREKGKKEGKKDALYVFELYSHLCKKVKVIWFEDDSDDEIALFTRLNIGRIPLTNAELIKALLLRRDDKWTDERRQNEIEMIWDDIENQFGDKDFWYFLTDDDQDKHPTKIDLLFKIVAKKLNPKFNGNGKDSFATFFCFNQMLEEKEMSKKELWDSILETYLLLREWYDSPATYNKIGFLVACGMSVNAFMKLASENETKSQFDQEVEGLISQRIETNTPYEELQYGQDNSLILHILHLFNIRSLNKVNQRYDFAKHKAEKWSLEHIHAQSSNGLSTVKEWREWLQWHLDVVRKAEGEAQTYFNEEGKEIVDDERFSGWDASLTSRMEEALDKGDGLTQDEFQQLFDTTVAQLQAFYGFGSEEELHRLSNLALLPRWQNSALNNSVFSVKRDKIIEMDKAGAFIPLCTRNVFLKYYSASQDTQLAFWSATDRDSYLKEIKEVLNIEEV